MRVPPLRGTLILRFNQGATLGYVRKNTHPYMVKPATGTVQML